MTWEVERQERKEVDDLESVEETPQRRLRTAKHEVDADDKYDHST